MDKVLCPVQDCTVTYIDDIIYSSTWEEHLIHLRRVLEELRRAGLTANPYKCRIARSMVDYLGFLVGRGEIQPQEEKVTKITQWYCLRRKREVQQFLSLVGYYRQFIPQFSVITAPLTDLTKKRAGRLVQMGRGPGKSLPSAKIGIM